MGVYIDIPEGTTRNPLEVKTGMALYGPFQFPHYVTSIAPKLIRLL